MRTQEAIIELLESNDPLPVNKIASHLGISEGYVRTTVKAMELSNMIEKVDNRLPYYYKVKVKSAGQYEKEIAQVKAYLLGDKEPRNEILAVIWNMSRAEWDKNLVLLHAIAGAVQELHNEGKLVDTL